MSRLLLVLTFPIRFFILFYFLIFFLAFVFHFQFEDSKKRTKQTSITLKYILHTLQLIK